MVLERDEILALIQNDPEAIVTIIQTLEETVRRLERRVAELERQRNMNSRNSSRPQMDSNDPKISVKGLVNALVVKKGIKAKPLSGVRVRIPSGLAVHPSAKGVVPLLRVLRQNPLVCGRIMMSPSLRSLPPSTLLKPWPALAAAGTTRIHALLISLHTCTAARVSGH